MVDDQVLLIGGVGGSGTRAVADVARSLGIHLGSNLNVSLDNLNWPGKQCAQLIRDQDKPFEEKLPIVSQAFQEFSAKMGENLCQPNGLEPFWGTKVPGSFYYLRYLNEIFRNVRYIHVMRHGLDMAFSNNHNQLLNWGKYLDVVPEGDPTPRYLLKYWARANTHALEGCEAHLPEHHLVVKSEDLCAHRHAQIKRIAEFLDVEADSPMIDSIAEKIVPQKSQGRYQRVANEGMFDDADLEILRKLGFSVTFLD